MNVKIIGRNHGTNSIQSIQLDAEALSPLKAGGRVVPQPPSKWKLSKTKSVKTVKHRFRYQYPK